MSVRHHLVAPTELDSALIDTWHALQATNERFSSPYFTPEYTKLVAEVRSDVRLVIIENGGRTVGFFPHQRGSLGLGKPVGGPFSDYHGVICAPESDWSVDTLLRAAKLSAFPFNHLVDDHAGRFLPYSTIATRSPQMDLHGGYSSYVENRRPKTNLITESERLARKCSREVGDLRFTFSDKDPRVLDLLFRWKSEQYKQSGIVDAFAVSWTRQLLSRVCQVNSPAFAGVPSSLRAGDRIVAVHLGMRSRDTMHWWFPAYDQEFARYRVGLISLLRLAESVANIGIRTLDFGKGDERYKQQLMSRSAPLLEGFAELPSALTTARRKIGRASCRERVS
jgi:CelD/BcsL family acetyltransferase involved in cellulose biosynthesis